MHLQNWKALFFPLKKKDLKPAKVGFVGLLASFKRMLGLVKLRPAQDKLKPSKTCLNQLEDQLAVQSKQEDQLEQLKISLNQLRHR